MTALVFPSNPTTGQQFENWTWDGTKWVCAGGAGGGGPGPPGPAGTITIGVTTTLSPGSNATVSNTGTSSDAILNFGIPSGAQGPPGTGLRFVGIVNNVTQLPATGNTNGDMYLVQSPNDELYVWIAEPAPGSWVDTGVSLGGGIPEAPVPGIYGRSNNSWVPLLDDGQFS